MTTEKTYAGHRCQNCGMLWGAGEAPEKCPDCGYGIVDVLFTPCAKPYTLAEIRKLAAEDPDGYIAGVVAVDLNEIIDADSESFLDLVSERLTGSEVLSDFGYKVVGHDHDAVLLFVQGDPSMLLDYPDEDDEEEARQLNDAEMLDKAVRRGDVDEE